MDAEVYTTFRDLAIIFANLMLIKYFLFLILSPFHPVREFSRKIKMLKSRPPGKVYNPKVSVVIPAWNEEVGVIKTIKTVLENTYGNIEIIVVNDGSTDSTSQKIRDFMLENFTLPTTLIGENYEGVFKFQEVGDQKSMLFIDKQINQGKGAALNSGILSANGEIILTVDSDSILDKNAIKNLVTYYEDPELDGIVGNVKVANANSILGMMQKLEYTFGFYFKRAHAMMGAEYIFGGACASFRRAVFDEIGLYDTHNKTEDIEMTMRFRYAGYKCTYAEDVICYTEGASSILGLVNQRLRWKKGRIDTFLKYRNLFFSTQKSHNKPLTWFILPFAVLSEIQLFFEPIFIALLTGYSIITLDFISLSFGILFLMVVYLVNALFSGSKSNLKLIFLFPATWLLFYFLVWIEFMALVRSVKLVVRGENLEWQKWNRKGI